MTNPPAYQASQSSYPQQLYAATQAGEQMPAQHVPQMASQTNEPAPTNNNMYNIDTNPGAIYYAAQQPAQNLQNPATEWLNWTRLNVALNPMPSDGPQEFVPPASALVALQGGRNATAQEGMQAPAPPAEDASNWPLNIFNTGQQNGAPGG
jgi:hypothetical protein